MKRREFITLLSGAAAWPVVARAQERLRRVALGERVRRRDFIAPIGSAADAGF